MPFDNLVYALFLNIINSKTDEVIATLEEHSIDIHTKLNKYGWTSLHAAAFKGNITLVKYLIQKGANKDSQNLSGMSARMLAVEAGHAEVVDIMDQAEHKDQPRTDFDVLFYQDVASSQ